MASLIGDAMLFGRPPLPRMEMVDLIAAVETVMAELKERADQLQCSCELTVNQEVSVWADPVQLHVVISNLINNSLNALSAGGTIYLEVGADQGVDDSPQGVLRVTDHGIGLNEIDRRHLFDPFYSGRQAGRGIGFGLPKCWRIVSNHGGRIEVDSTEGGPTTFFVYWPSTSNEVETEVGIQQNQ